MKFTTLAQFLAASTCAIAQIASCQPAQVQLPAIDLAHTSQAGCPVQILRASFAPRPARYLPVADDRGAPGSLSLEYRNTSGKEIALIELQTEMLIKRSLYDLDATAVGIRMTLRGPALAEGAQRSQSLPVGGNVFGYKSTRLTRTLYTDGTEWRPASQQVCELLGNTDLQTGIAK